MPALLHEAHAANRRMLANDLADVIEEHGFDAATALALPAGGWALAVSLVASRRGRPVETPSPDTLMAAVEVLRARERAAVRQPDDPFEGLPS